MQNADNKNTFSEKETNYLLSGKNGKVLLKSINELEASNGIKKEIKVTSIK